MPSHGGDDAGTIARRKPRRAASASRRRAWATWRTSPPSPTSPTTTSSAADRLVDDGAGDGDDDGEVDARLDEADAADGRGVDVLVGDAQPGAPLEHGEQQGQPAAVEALGVAPRRRRPAAIGTVSAWTSTSSGRWPSIAGTTTDPATAARRSARNSCDGSGTPASPALGHLEQAELVGRAEAVLDGPQQAQGVVALALERQHGVDDVLEHAGPGERAVLGDVADEHDRRRRAAWPRRRAAGRTRGPGRPSPATTASRWSAIVWMLSTTTSDGAVRSMASTTPASVVSPASHRSGRTAAEPLGPQAHLLGALLGADVQRGARPRTPAAAAAACSCRCPARRRAA